MTEIQDHGLENLVDIIANNEGLYRTKVLRILEINGFYYELDHNKINDKKYVIETYMEKLDNKDNVSDDFVLISDGLFTLDVDLELEKLKEHLVKETDLSEDDISLDDCSVNFKYHLKSLAMDKSDLLPIEEVILYIKVNAEIYEFTLMEAFMNYEAHFEILFESIAEKIKRRMGF